MGLKRGRGRLPAGRRIRAQVGETLDARRGLSNQILFDTLRWQAAMLLAVATLVWFAVRLVLRPLMRLKSAVETRALSDLSDVDPALVHREMRPLVTAMNGAMGRLQNLIASQRRFIADAFVPHIDRWHEAGIYDRDVWTKAGAAGLLCATMPEEYGGAGGSFAHEAVINRELSLAGFDTFGAPLHSGTVTP